MLAPKTAATGIVTTIAPSSAPPMVHHQRFRTYQPWIYLVHANNEYPLYLQSNSDCTVVLRHPASVSRAHADAEGGVPPEVAVKLVGRLGAEAGRVVEIGSKGKSSDACAVENVSCLVIDMQVLMWVRRRHEPSWRQMCKLAKPHHFTLHENSEPQRKRDCGDLQATQRNSTNISAVNSPDNTQADISVPTLKAMQVAPGGQTLPMKRCTSPGTCAVTCISSDQMTHCLSFGLKQGCMQQQSPCQADAADAADVKCRLSMNGQNDKQPEEELRTGGARAARCSGCRTPPAAARHPRRTGSRPACSHQAHCQHFEGTVAKYMPGSSPSSRLLGARQAGSPWATRGHCCVHEIKVATSSFHQQKKDLLAT